MNDHSVAAQPVDAFVAHAMPRTDEICIVFAQGQVAIGASEARVLIATIGAALAILDGAHPVQAAVQTGSTGESSTPVEARAGCTGNPPPPALSACSRGIDLGGGGVTLRMSAAPGGRRATLTPAEVEGMMA